ncbi:MAG: ABC transporter ATP-binding protein, partial [Clostridia bacterium]
MGLKVENVSKSFGEKKAVKSISFEIDKPGVFGLLGTNGAGKTTTIRMILGIIKKDQGEITWNGKEVIRKHVNFGYLPEERGIYPKTKIYDQLMYFAKLKGMSKQQADEQIKYWMKRLEMEQYIDMTAEKLSKGNQQKIQFITAVMH